MDIDLLNRGSTPLASSHAGAKRRRAGLNFPSVLQKTTAWQASRMQRFFYVYVLVCESNETIHYTGITQDLQARLIKHNQGKVCAHRKTSSVANSDRDSLRFRG